MNKNNYKAHLAILGANIIYGVNNIIAKGIMLTKIGPNAFIFLQIFGGTSLLFWFIIFFIKEKIEPKDYIRLIICGILGIAINQLLYFHELNLTSPIDASIIMTVVPVKVLIFSYFLLKERFMQNKLICSGH